MSRDVGYMSSDGIRSHNMCDRVSFAIFSLLQVVFVRLRFLLPFFLCLSLKSQKSMQIKSISEIHNTSDSNDPVDSSEQTISRS